MKISQATVKDVDMIAELFDQYRQFYEQPADLAGCHAYIKARLENGESTIFMAQLENGQAIGFTQLYDSFCSVAMTPIVYLYDLYVAQAHRREGVGRALMARAEQYARKKNASRLTLETGIDNKKAQALYESIGYVRNIEFYGYDFGISSND